MGVVHCLEHGHIGSNAMCRHVKEDLDNKIFPATVNFPHNGFKFCTSCFEKAGLNRFEDIVMTDFLKVSVEESISFQEKQTAALMQIEPLQYECVLCCKEIELAYLRARNLPDSFPVFEKTLRYDHQEEIDQLGSYLRSNYQFQIRRDPNIERA